ncbi:calexcitin-2-like [Artemia franciscana]|uniref:calexcitin-2-like n=1 Tax=Artemia franciscana TaxID=6661 RepID=UPI0032DA0EBA
MPISEFRKKKLLHVFRTFFDTDQSGKIEKKDFELAAERLAKIRSWSSSSEQAKEAAKCLLQVWEGIKNADIDNDNQVSFEEWCNLWESYSNGTNKNEWQNNYMDFMFDLNDTTGDGHLDQLEFTAEWKRYNVTDEECNYAYAKISQGKPFLTKSDYKALWHQYFTSDDPASPGNFLFGKAV